MARALPNSRSTTRYAQERAHLLDALGALTEGGIVEAIEHIGATSIAALPGRPVIDIGLSVWPFPLDPPNRAALNELGYILIPDEEDDNEQRFRHSSHSFTLFVTAAGRQRWPDYLLIRDYLAHDEAARRDYANQKQAWAEQDTDAYQAAKETWFRERLDAAEMWWVYHHGFAPVEAAADELREFEEEWYISSGWALDLYLGRVTRIHHDVDVVIPHTVQLALQKYLTDRDWKLLTPFEQKLAPWPAHMRLEFPRHQVHAHREGTFLDFLLTDIERGIWRYRRDPIILRSAERMALRSRSDIPFLAPELVMLFKSCNTSNQARPQDQQDFELLHRQLDPERRAWLLWALTATDPTHPWIERLAPHLQPPI